MKPAVQQKVNIIIDILLFLVMIVVAVIGVAIRYLLISGAERWEKYGENVQLTMLGFERHEWGKIHLAFGIILLVLLVLHLFFHWTQMVRMIKKNWTKAGLRIGFLSAFSGFCILIVLSPLFIPLEIGEPLANHEGRFTHKMVAPRQNLVHQSSEKILQTPTPAVTLHPIAEGENQTEKPTVWNKEQVAKETIHVSSKETNNIEVKGFQNIAEVAAANNVSTAKLKEKLNLPASISNQQKLGRLRKEFGFTMSDVERAISELQKH